jgi:hypothetical protein
VPNELNGPCYYLDANSNCFDAWGIYFQLNSTTQLNPAICNASQFDQSNTLMITCEAVAQRTNNLQPAFSADVTWVSQSSIATICGNPNKRGVKRGATQMALPAPVAARRRSPTTSAQTVAVDITINIGQNSAVFAGYSNAFLAAVNATGGNYTAILQLLSQYCQGTCTNVFLTSQAEVLSVIFTVTLGAVATPSPTPTAAPTPTPTSLGSIAGQVASGLQTQSIAILAGVFGGLGALILLVFIIVAGRRMFEKRN